MRLWNRSVQALATQAFARAGGAAILPDDGIADGTAGGALPDQRGLALVRDAHGSEVVRGESRLGERFARRCELRGPDHLRILLDPPGLRIDLRQFALGKAEDAPAGVEDECAGTRGALVEGEDGSHGRADALC